MCRAQGLGFRVQYLGFRVQGLRFLGLRFCIAGSCSGLGTFRGSPAIARGSEMLRLRLKLLSLGFRGA